MRPHPPHARRHATALAVAAALAVLVLALVLPRPLTDGRPGRGAAQPLPEGTSIVRPADGLGTAVAGYGDVWIDDRADDHLLRVRSPDGRVLARIPTRGRVALAVGAGGVWALQSSRGFGPYLRGPVLHVDPRTNRVRARVALRAPSGDGVLGIGVIVDRDRVWVWGPRDILRIDPRADRVAQRIRVDDRHGDLTSLAARGGRLIAASADGTLQRIDARTGAFRGATRMPFIDPQIRASVGSRLVITSRGVLAAIEPGTGRVAWSRRLGFRAGSVVHAYGLLWTHSADFHEPGDRLSGFDPATGERVTTSFLPAFGTTGIVSVRGRLLAPTSSGRLLVITPLVL